jgi:sugar diacid utilization regulator
MKTLRFYFNSDSDMELFAKTIANFQYNSVRYEVEKNEDYFAILIK